MATSLRNWGPAGSSTPCDRCTRLIESSTVTNCSPLACRSRSLRPRQGKISACCPVTRCDRFSLVDTCAVSRQRPRAVAVRSVSGVAARKLPPRATNTLACPAPRAAMVATVSRPGRRGAWKPKCDSRRSRNGPSTCSKMPIVRSPCTLLCPRTGQAPAPGRPKWPPSSNRLTTCWMPATAWRCWVRPMAQQAIIRRLLAAISAASPIRCRSIPLSSSSSGQGSAARCAARSAKPSVYCSTKPRSTTDMDAGRPASSSSIALAIPFSRAVSPPMRTGRCRQAMAVPRPSISSGFWGWRNRLSATSASGLMLTMRQPRRAACCNVVSMRGWLVPGF